MSIQAQFTLIQLQYWFHIDSKSWTKNVTILNVAYSIESLLNITRSMQAQFTTLTIILLIPHRFPILNLDWTTLNIDSVLDISGCVHRDRETTPPESGSMTTRILHIVREWIRLAKHLRLGYFRDTDMRVIKMNGFTYSGNSSHRCRLQFFNDKTVYS